MSEADDIAKVYLLTFAARDDVYAEWATDHWRCVRAPLTPAVIRRAFAGGPSISGYTITTDGMTHVCAVDFDTEDGWDLARRLRDVMWQRDALAYIEPSRRGAHLFSVLDEVIPARIVRRALRGFLAEALIPESPKIELRPGHDEIRPDGVGFPIRLPTMPHPKTGKRYPLCGPDDRPIGNTLRDILLAYEDADADAYREMAARVAPTTNDIKPGDRSPRPQRPQSGASASEILRRLYGVENAAAGRSVRCPKHDDNVASLSISSDDARAWCHSSACELNNDGRGRGTWELEHFAWR